MNKERPINTEDLDFGDIGEMEMPDFDASFFDSDTRRNPHSEATAQRHGLRIVEGEDSNQQEEMKYGTE